MIARFLPPTLLALVAAILVARDRTHLALMVGIVAFLALQLSLLAPQALTAATAAVGRGAATVVRTVLLAIVQLVVVFPTWLVRVLTGASPLGLKNGRWADRADGVIPNRPFARDRRSHTGRRRTWRGSVALVVLGALLALVVPRAWDEGDPEQDVPVDRRGQFFNPFDSPALAGRDWVETTARELGEISATHTYTSYVGLSLGDYDGEFVNVAGRARTTYEPAPIDGAEPLDVWFFGGSTMFGFSAQRDMHTIPSEFVRLAEGDGLVVNATNYGSAGYVNLQETLLLAQLLSTGRTPDLVVFYDGINDTAVQLQHVFAGIGPAGEPSDIFAFTARQALAGQLTGSAAPPAPIQPPIETGRPPQAAAARDAILRVYQQGIGLSYDLADQREFEVAHFWQPDLYNKVDLHPGEQQLVEALGMDDFRYGALAEFSRDLLDVLPAGVIDISDAYDGADEPILTDQVHTNEVGARLIAEAMYEELADDLRRLTGAP